MKHVRLVQGQVRLSSPPFSRLTTTTRPSDVDRVTFLPLGPFSTPMSVSTLPRRALEVCSDSPTEDATSHDIGDHTVNVVTTCARTEGAGAGASATMHSVNAFRPLAGSLNRSFQVSGPR